MSRAKKHANDMEPITRLMKVIKKQTILVNMKEQKLPHNFHDKSSTNFNKEYCIQLLRLQEVSNQINKALKNAVPKIRILKLSLLKLLIKMKCVIINILNGKIEGVILLKTVL